jgi:hypothetical protein
MLVVPTDVTISLQKCVCVCVCVLGGGGGRCGWEAGK